MRRSKHLWDGAQWVDEKSATLPGMLKLSELAAFAEKNGIPPSAEFRAETEYDEQGPEVLLTWYVPVEEK